MAIRRKLKAILIDLSGTLHVDDKPIDNTINALERLRQESSISIRFVTNTTKESKDTLLARLHRIGFTSIQKDELFSSLSAASQYVQQHNLNPFYFLTDDARNDFKPNDEASDLDSVVIGLAPEKFTYDNMNQAFRILMNKNNKLIAIHQAKYFKKADGLAVGPGCFVRGLVFSTGNDAVVIGKPNPFFFSAAIPSGIEANECCMIGDDANDDIAGALQVDMKGILVKTGKYIDGIERTMQPLQPTATLESFAKAVDFLIDNKFEL